jgi:hypothetical protein
MQHIIKTAMLIKQILNQKGVWHHQLQSVSPPPKTTPGGGVTEKTGISNLTPISVAATPFKAKDGSLNSIVS